MVAASYANAVKDRLPPAVAARYEHHAFAPGPPRVQPALDDASVQAFHLAMLVTAALVALGGVLSAVGIENPRRSVPCEGCPGGAAVGAGRDPALVVVGAK